MTAYPKEISTWFVWTPVWKVTPAPNPPSPSDGTSPSVAATGDGTLAPATNPTPAPAGTQAAPRPTPTPPNVLGPSTRNFKFTFSGLWFDAQFQNYTITGQINGPTISPQQTIQDGPVGSQSAFGSASVDDQYSFMIDITATLAPGKIIQGHFDQKLPASRVWYYFTVIRAQTSTGKKTVTISNADSHTDGKEKAVAGQLGFDGSVNGFINGGYKILSQDTTTTGDATAATVDLFSYADALTITLDSR